MRFVLVIAIVMVGCTQSDDQKVRADVHKAAEEVKADAKKATKEIDKDLRETREKVRKAVDAPK